MIDEITHDDNLLLMFPFFSNYYYISIHDGPVQLMITKELLVMNNLCVFPIMCYHLLPIFLLNQKFRFKSILDSLDYWLD